MELKPLINIYGIELTISETLTAISILVTSIFSFLVWRATVNSNKIANAIRKQTEIEKSKTNDQNRFVVKYNLSQILTTLYKHSEEKGLGSTERREIKESIEEIEEFPLALYFSEKEIEDILDLIKYLKSDFDNKFFTATAYGINPMNASEAEFAKLKEEIKQKNKKKMSIVNEAKERVRKVLEVL